VRRREGERGEERTVFLETVLMGRNQRIEALVTGTVLHGKEMIGQEEQHDTYQLPYERS
jgi:hypothetical protein